MKNKTDKIKTVFNRVNHVVVSLIFSVAGYCCYSRTHLSVNYSLYSPSGNFRVCIFTKNNSTLNYIVTNDTTLLIDTSLMGIKVSSRYYGLVKRIEKVEKETIVLNKPLLHNKTSTVSSAIKYKIPIVEESGDTWFLEAILSDDGYAFRYNIPGKNLRHIDEEKTNFRLPESSQIWYFERDNAWKLKSYAGEWVTKPVNVMQFASKQGPVQGIPLVIQTKNNKYTVLAEAGCYNYSGMRLKAIGANTFQVNFTEEEVGFSLSDTILTPWRTILFANDLNELVNNNFIANVSPKPDSSMYADTKYIKAGKCIWRWWAKETGTPQEEKSMVDKAVALNAQYVLIDDGWQKWPNVWKEIKYICMYAKKKNIGVWLWKDSHDLESEGKSFNAWLDSVRDMGAVGIKVDFFNSESKEVILFQKKIILAAAQRKLMVDLHGCSAGSGEYYSFPNQLTREGIRGLELNKLEEGPITASHNAALLFTRFLMGPADYTPLGLTAPGQTSWAQQLATLVTFTSPLLVIAEDPAFLLNDKKAALCLSFIRNVPSVWDETIVLPKSSIGELCAVARRSGDKWFIGVINAGKDRDYTIDLSFLKGPGYRYQFFNDNLSDKKLNIQGLNRLAKIKSDSLVIPFQKTMGEISRKDKINVHLAQNGGFAAMILPH